MATARTLHNDVLYYIPFESDGTVPPADQCLQIGSLDSIAFQNGATVPVKVVFTGQFAPITLPVGAQSGAQGGITQLNTTINYTLFNASTNVQLAGPYAVQFGVGPLLIKVSNFNTTPDPIMIPKGGEIQFDCIDGPHPISWTFGNKTPANNVWSPQPANLSTGMNIPPQKALPSANGQTLIYAFPRNEDTRGGGTVVIAP